MATQASTSIDDPRRWARRCLILFWLLLLVLMHYPSTLKYDLGFRWWDKVGHFIAYGLLTGLVGWWVFATRSLYAGRSVVARGALIVLGVAVYGLLDEWTQPLTGRDFDWWDWAVDSLAATLVGAAVTLLVLKRARTATAESPAG